MAIYRFIYPVRLTPDNKDGGYVVTCRDLPEAITQGNSVKQCLIEATDCLEEALAGRIRCEETIPLPSDCLEGEYPVNVPLQTAMKAALALAMKEAGTSKFDLAQQLHVAEKEISHLLDPQQNTNLPEMERALAALGRYAELLVV